MAEVLRVDADLVRPPRLQPEPHERRVLHRLDERVVRDGVLPALLRHDRHPPPVARVAPEERLDRPALRLGHAPDDREVAAADRPLHELPRERRVRRVVLRHDEQAGGVLVEAVDDAGAHGDVAGVGRGRRRRREADVLVVGLLVFILERDGLAADVVQERVDERAGAVAVGRVDDHPGGLVDDQEVVVFVDHIERDRLGAGFDRRRSAEAALDPVAGGDGRRDLRLDGAVDGHAAVLDPALDLRARRVREFFCEVHVEPLPGAVALGHLDLDDGFLRFFRLAHTAKGGAGLVPAR